LWQSRDNAVVDDMTLKVVTKRAPTDAELRTSNSPPRRQALKSNTIVYARESATAASRRPDEPGDSARHRRAPRRWMRRPN